MNNDQSTYFKTPKTVSYNGPHQEKIYKNRNLQRQFNEQENIDPRQYSEQILISDPAIVHSIATRLPMVRIHCNPALRSKDTGVQFIKDFMKYIALNFRNEYPRHKDPIGLDQWWLQDDGNLLCGVTDDIDFYMYLCDDNHCPSSTDDVFYGIKPRFSSIFMVNGMMGITQSSARHIRVIFKQQNEYEKILYDGRIVIQGLVLDVDEYLPLPKISICTECNLSGHIKKTCQAPYVICRRCGQNKENGDNHIECVIQCRHCGVNHISTDYKCPTIVNFRKNLLDKLKNNTDKLPVHVQATDTSLSNEYLDSAIRAFDNELNKIKKDFDEEKNRINSLYEKQIETVKKGWLILQQQVRAQNECLASIQQVIGTTIGDEQKEHIESMKNANGAKMTHLMQLKDSFQREMIQYSTIMQKKIELYQSAMESIFSAHNG
ncbi:unnamed protein product [Didymodactylos carnosus]|uniref:CCHC-type domain-containing protein n=1 Tax=Didymodactylos carnosus TaxID=1234261 RepID=A0A814UCK7_9BILA|nr:unnamed protein product [Didymodactylos carnosus]CAF1239543.1 unnamed protein product [Didymodactylos carnosus]CAF3936510.1 unnamed protein product [Didymodactylos carnosus]CAF4046982.1 unnamed protein product [Didymodactylos carnosus]